MASCAKISNNLSSSTPIEFGLEKIRIRGKLIRNIVGMKCFRRVAVEKHPVEYHSYRIRHVNLYVFVCLANHASMLYN